MTETQSQAKLPKQSTKNKSNNEHPSALAASLSKLHPSQLKRLFRATNLMNALPNITSRSDGELFTIYVHIIECRDLKPISNDTICDPVCSIKILSHKLSTKKQKKTFNPYFDQMLIRKINLTPEELSTEKVKISIHDTNSLLRNESIGSYEYDLSYIYSNTNHEIYKQWTGLFNPKQISQGIKGYLKCSIAVLGPNDEKYIHPPSDDKADDHNDISNVILPPFIHYEYKQLIVHIHQTKCLANMTYNKPPTYVIMVQFAAKQLISEEIVNTNHESIIDWNLKALLPLRQPNFQKNITISILQRISGRKRLISRWVMDYNELMDKNDMVWYNSYGSHFEFNKYDTIQNKAVATQMDSNRMEPTCFRGQIAISCSIEDIDADKEPQTQMSQEPISDADDTNALQEQPPPQYMMQVDVYEATNVMPGKYALKIQCGSQYWQTHIQSTSQTEKCNVYWNECLNTNDDPNLMLLHHDQVDHYPFIFVYLLKIIPNDKSWFANKDEGELDLTMISDDIKCIPFAYAKITLKDLLSAEWQVPPQWVILKEDRCFNILKTGLPHPSVLLSIRGGAIDSFDGRITSVCRPFISLKTEGNIQIVMQCEENNTFIDCICVYLNNQKWHDQRDTNDPFQIHLQKENVSVYDRITIHRISTELGAVVGEITFEIGDLLSYSSLHNQQTEYKFENEFITHPPTIFNDFDMNETDHKLESFNTNDRVKVIGKCDGVIRYIGDVEFTEQTPIFGVELTKPIGTNNGTKGKKTYFTCNDGYGIFVPMHRIQKVNDMNERNTIHISDHVIVRNKGKGIVRFIGDVDFTDGTMYGIELIDANGSHDGMIKGKRYFKCTLKHGIFTRVSSLKRSGLIPSKSDKKDDKEDAFDIIEVRTTEQLQMEDRIKVKNKGIGHIRFIGKTHFSQNEIVYGVELIEALGLNEGSKDNKRYFQCEPLHGLFTRFKNIISKYVPKPPRDAFAFKLNDLINVTKKGKGYIRYIGPLHFLSGAEHVFGIELCEKAGNHNGTIKGQKYFECKPHYGIFCRKHQIESVPVEALQKMLMNKYVKVKSKGNGHVRFIGHTSFAGDTVVIGIDMDKPVGNSNGTKNGTQYFVCRDNHGLFTIKENVSLQSRAPPLPPLPTKAQCLHPQTLIAIMNPSTFEQKPIKQIESGDSILCYDPLTKQLVPSIVTHTFEVSRDTIATHPMIKLTVIGDRTICIQCTENHCFYENNKNKYMMAKDLVVGDVLTVYNQISQSLQNAPLHSIEPIPHDIDNTRTVYDLSIQQYNNYFANSILCHNMNPLPPVPSSNNQSQSISDDGEHAVNLDVECEQPETIKIHGTFYRYPLTENEISEQMQHPTMVGKPMHKEYQLFIGLYQCRRLLPSDETGLSDPYVIIHSYGNTFKSDIVKKRLNPVWHRGYLQNIILPDPIQYAPPLLVQVWDYDPSSLKKAYSNKDNDFLGSCYISTHELMGEELNVISPTPRWYPLYIPDKKDTSKQIKLQSEVLLNVQLISGHNQTIETLNKSLMIFDQQNERQKLKEIQAKHDTENDAKETEEEKEKEDEAKEEEKASEIPKTPKSTKSKLSKLLSPFRRKKKHKSESKNDDKAIARKAQRKRKINPRFIDLTPRLHEVEIQIYVLGLRDINTSIGMINKPFITIHFPNGSNLATNPSNIPSTTNPNFCQLFTVKMNLPTESIFAPAIRVAVRDTLIGVGDIMSKFGKSAGKATQKRMGWTFIQLQTYLKKDNNEGNDGWIHPDEFRKRHIMIKNKQKFESIDPVLLSATMTDAEKEEYLENKKQREMEEKKLERLSKAMMLAKMRNNSTNGEESDHDEDRSYYGESDEDDADNFKSIMQNIMGDAAQNNDNNLAVYSDDDDNSFGWSTEDGYNEEEHHTQDNEADKDNENNMNWLDLIGLYRIPELRDRTIYEQPLEEKLDLNPFIFNQIYAGKAKDRKHIADLKVLIRLKTETESETETLSHLVSPTDIMCRLYVLRGLDLIPKQSDKDSTCDPYFVVSLNNKDIINTRKTRKHNTCDPEFYDTHEVAVKLPGDSTLKISVYDWNGDDVAGAVGGLVGIHSNDDLIGETVIDLEDRWFSSLWHYLTDKPIERRNILHPSSKHRQGQLEIILEMLKLDSAKRLPLIDISPPPVEEWELRLIIWECRNVTSKDSLSGLNDLYVSCSLISNEYIEEIGKQINNKSQKTDVHYRAKDGFGSFNYRMIWDIYLPCKQPPRLKIQLFDKDFGSDDSICECIFSLKELYKAGFIKKDTVTLYEDNSDKILLDNLKHPNFIENQGEILISLQMMPKQIANEFPAGKGRDAPNQNPILFPPNGRIGFSMNPYKIISQIVGPSIMRKFKLYAFLCCLIGGFVMFAPVIAMTIFNKLIDSLNPF